ncbi:HpcH/HpaI aldolase family protein [Paramicrobacterium agarici]|uniref:4-hydroxy-2-oxoheptanedioate aldolase n=1 Tax=Paramicrobacterium agarici TaxID=630514 RepID=A0A2A9DXV9_9MICO|nr:HpcH/HpaI aldolase/citrate lyase family protein [Microbacterium agarici]PFG30759.1 4-hydroxy-2-oxoheptanedioate aldolase [Microbacterium agarici]TQO23761.1 2,4-dihydroxyhept-2-enedioate aldolase [Microbacterium agarici]
MPIRLSHPPTLRERLAGADRPLVGMWISSGSPLNAEICAGSGLDMLLVDGEHSHNTLETILSQLQAISAYPVTPLVRVPVCDPVIIKQYLDIGVQNLLVPMVDTAEDAAKAVAAVRYPPRGVRGVGSALARASRWNRVDGYLNDADDTISLYVQIESADAVANAREIAAVDGIDGVFIGPADLAASMGHLGQQSHPAVAEAVSSTIRAMKDAGVSVGINAFVPEVARQHVSEGVDFVFVAADVSLLARASEALAAAWLPGEQGESERASY